MHRWFTIFYIPQKANSNIGNLRQLNLCRPLSLSLFADNASYICH